MRWQGGEQSENLEDRRSMGPKGMAIGGIGALILMAIGYFLGVDPQMLQQFIGNAQNAQVGGNGNGEARPLTPEEKRSHDFAATILRFTEEVWDEQFTKIGQRYVPPHMVLFTAQVET